MRSMVEGYCTFSLAIPLHYLALPDGPPPHQRWGG
jgi:hypothetical protein